MTCASQPFPPAAIAKRLLAWYRTNGRDLPWRRTRDPYRIWLSEIMLQQTGVTTVIPYYEKFLKRFPTVGDLAEAPLDEVIELWAGLGYYSRARNLHAAARAITRDHGGRFPAELQALRALPGVGRSTAGAILSIAFDRQGPILDGNVRRVLCRLYALQEEPRSSAAERRLWQWAEALTPADRPHDYAQAIMDLGATVCVPRRPDCPACPLAGLCQARRLGLENELPVKRQKKQIPTRLQVALLAQKDGRYLVRQRPYEGMLGGLWEFPGAPVPAGGTPAAAVAVLARELGLEGRLCAAGRVDHAYSHFRLDLYLFLVPVAQQALGAEGDRSCWADLAELAAMPLHGAHKKALKLLAGGGRKMA